MSPGSSPQPTDGAPSPRLTRSWRQRVVLGLGIVVVVGCLLGAAGVSYGWWRLNQIDRQDLSLSASNGGPQNYLIVGSDSRSVVSKKDADAGAFLNGETDGAGQRSDTIMIARVDPAAKTIDLLSFPRDLWVPIARTGGSERINTAYGYNDGAQRLVDTIREDFGVDINHYIEVNFKSFKDVVQAVDGVPMYFDRAMRDYNTGLFIDEPGCVTLDGDQALAFARSRHLEYKDAKGKWQDDPTGDLGRINRQQVFIRRVTDRATAKATTVNLKTTNDLIGATVQNLSVDQGFDVGDMFTLAKQFRDFRGDAMRTHSVPVTAWTTSGGAAVLKMDQPAADEVLNIFRGLPAGSISPSAVTLSVQNGSGVDGQAAQVRAALEAVGFTITETSQAATSRDRTTVRYAPGSEREADLVARHLTSGAVLKSDSSLAKGKVVLVVGPDFTTVMREARPVDDSTTSTGAPSTSTTNPAGSGRSSTVPATTSTTDQVYDGPMGVAPGDPPPGVSCG